MSVVQKRGLTIRHLLAIAIVALSAAGCLKGPYDKTAVAKKFVDRGHGNFFQYAAADRPIHYVAAGRRGAPLVLMIHGTPGSWHAYAELITDDVLLSGAYLVAVDRPGFGKSGNGRIVSSLKQQAAYLVPIIERESSTQSAILVGHSLGAPIAARLAMDYPDNVTGILLIAPSIDPALEEPRWYNRLAEFTPVAWALPEELVLANREILPLPAELTKMLAGWSRIQVPVIVVQGMRDRLVSPANADFAERMLQDRATVLRVADQGHFILWNRPALVRDQIMALLQQP